MRKIIQDKVTLSRDSLASVSSFLLFFSSLVGLMGEAGLKALRMEIGFIVDDIMLGFGGWLYFE